MQLSSLSRRSLSTRSSSSSQWHALQTGKSRPNCLAQQQFQRTWRRAYADDATSAPPPPKPKKRFRLLRWAWRLTWLAGIGLTGAVAYSVYSLRHPEEQYEPDPKKKTLVILGMLVLHAEHGDGADDRVFFFFFFW